MLVWAQHHTIIIGQGYVLALVVGMDYGLHSRARAIGAGIHVRTKANCGLGFCPARGWDGGIHIAHIVKLGIGYSHLEQLADEQFAQIFLFGRAGHAVACSIRLGIYLHILQKSFYYGCHSANICKQKMILLMML